MSPNLLVKRILQLCHVRLFNIPIIVLLCLTNTNSVGSTDGDGDDAELRACSTICSYNPDYFAAGCEDLYLTQIPSVAGLCRDAKVLHLEHNGIRVVHPNDLIQYTSLQFLYIGHNEISEIPTDMCGNATGLKHLQLNNNNIRSVAIDAFWRLKSLKELVLDSNEIEDIRVGSFNKLSLLESLQLHDNALTEIPSNVFANLVSLNTLNIDNNGLNQIHDDSFSGLNRLIRLSLQNNAISFLQLNTFQSLTSLSVLAIDGNYLTTIDTTMFRGLPLTKVSLRNNNITTITNLSEWLSENISLSTLTLSGNPLHCDCDMEALRAWLIAKNDEDTMPATCASPAEFRGMRLRDIKQNLCHSVIGLTTQSRHSLGVGAGSRNNNLGSDDTWKIIIVACVVFLALVAIVGGFFLIQKRRGHQEQEESESIQYSSVNQSASSEAIHRRRITSETQLMSDVDSAAYESYTIPPDARGVNQRPARNGFATQTAHPRAPLVKQASTGSATTSPDIALDIPVASSTTKPVKFTTSEADIPELEFDTELTCTNFGQNEQAVGRSNNRKNSSPPQYPPPPPPRSSSQSSSLSSSAVGTDTGYLPLSNLNVRT